MSLGFQVCDVQKPLAVVWRIADKGNLVQFGPNPKDNFIQNVITKRKIPMIKKGGLAGGDDDVKSEVEVMAVRPEEDEREDEVRKEARSKWGPMLSGCARRRRTEF